MDMKPAPADWTHDEHWRDPSGTMTRWTWRQDGIVASLGLLGGAVVHLGIRRDDNEWATAAQALPAHAAVGEMLAWLAAKSA